MRKVVIFALLATFFALPAKSEKRVTILSCINGPSSLQLIDGNIVFEGLNRYDVMTRPNSEFFYVLDVVHWTEARNHDWVTHIKMNKRTGDMQLRFGKRVQGSETFRNTYSFVETKCVETFPA